jgi:hypothetical protein
VRSARGVTRMTAGSGGRIAAQKFSSSKSAAQKQKRIARFSQSWNCVKRDRLLRTI